MFWLYSYKKERLLKAFVNLQLNHPAQNHPVILTLQTCFSVLVKSFWDFSDRIVELSQERQGEREERHKATGPGLI